MNRLVFKPTRLSIIIPVLDSHEIIKRQLKYFRSLKLPDDIEIILMDDGSDPPLNSLEHDIVRNLYIYPTGDKRPWTQACAKNLGAKIAQGVYLLMTDIDHILPREAIKAAYNFEGDKMGFTRSLAILDENGRISQIPEVLFEYGLSKERYLEKGLNVCRHVNTFVMRKRIFQEIDGYNPKCCKGGRHPTRDDAHLQGKYRRYCKAGKCKPEEQGPEVYVFPATDGESGRLFHKLNRR